MGTEPESTEPSASGQESPSRSEAKRAAEAMTALGERLIALPEAQLARIPMDDRLTEAVALARRISARGGRRRQVHYVGKLLRRMDTEGIEQALARLDAGHAAEKRAHHRLEQWTATLLEGEECTFTDLKDAHPDADLQQVRQWVRNARRELDLGKPPRSRRALFRYLRTLMDR